MSIEQILQEVTVEEIASSQETVQRHYEGEAEAGTGNNQMIMIAFD